MARKAKRRGSPAAALWGFGLWAAVVVLLVAVGWLLAHLGRDLPGREPSRRLAAVEAVVGPLRTSGLRVRAADGPSARAMASRLRMAAAGAGAAVSSEKSSPTSVALRIRDGGREYPVEVFWLPPGPRLAVVIDDLGRSRDEAVEFLDLPVPVTPAILPHQPHSSEIAGLARARGTEFLLHLPMEPQDYPSTNPGEGALLSGMTEGQVRELLDRALRSVPGASGVNNHMGSRLSEQEQPMLWVMDELRARGLYFLDSLTSPDSAAGRAAGRAGIAWTQRDVFLDNVREEPAVRAQLRKAVEKAKAAGRAVAIGHGNETTLRVLRECEPMLREAGVHVVPLRELLQAGGGA